MRHRRASVRSLRGPERGSARRGQPGWRVRGCEPTFPTRPGIGACETGRPDDWDGGSRDTGDNFDVLRGESTVIWRTLLDGFSLLKLCEQNSLDHPSKERGHFTVNLMLYGMLIPLVYRCPHAPLYLGSNVFQSAYDATGFIPVPAICWCRPGTFCSKDGFSKYVSSVTGTLPERETDRLSATVP